MAWAFLWLYCLYLLLRPIRIGFNRIDTWISRIENFNSGVDNGGNYQIERAKTAIATGGLLGVGAGKSVMKNFYLRVRLILSMQ